MSTPEELEARLRQAMHSEADATRASPDALVRIRGRVSSPKSSRAPGGWLRPVAVASAMAFTLVVGTLAGVKIASNGGDKDTVADQPSSVLFNPAATSAPKETARSGNGEGPAPKATPKPQEYLPGFAPQPTPVPEATADPFAALTGPARTHKIPDDTGGSYVSITGPDSGATVGRSFELSGQARTFEANVVIEVSQNGTVVKRDSTTASIGAPEKGDWTKVLVLAPGAYRIDAFEESMEGNGKRLASDTIWLTVADAPHGASKDSEPGGGSVPADAAPAEPAATPGPATGSAPGPAVEPANGAAPAN